MATAADHPTTVHGSFDVVIPAHDAAQWIEEAVRSAVGQALAPARVTVVADACSDDTAALARASGAQVLKVDARSVAYARNRGAAMGAAPWIAFLDADDRWPADWLGAAARASALAPTADLLYGTVEDRYADGTRRIRRRRQPAGDVFEDLLCDCFIATSATVVRRSCFEAAGGFDERFTGAGVEDYDLWLRIAQDNDLAPVVGTSVEYARIEGSALRSPARFARLREQTLSVVERAMLRRTVPAALRRRSRANVYRMSAERLLAQGAVHEARWDALRALRARPDDPHSWALMALSGLPATLRLGLIELRRRLRAD